MPREDVLAPGISLGLNLRFLICGIPQNVSATARFMVILMGLIGVVVPTVRRQNFYVEEVRMMKKEEACPMKRRR